MQSLPIKHEVNAYRKEILFCAFTWPCPARPDKVWNSPRQVKRSPASRTRWKCYIIPLNLSRASCSFLPPNFEHPQYPTLNIHHLPTLRPTTTTCNHTRTQASNLLHLSCCLVRTASTHLRLFIDLNFPVPNLRPGSSTRQLWGLAKESWNSTEVRLIPSSSIASIAPAASSSSKWAIPFHYTLSIPTHKIVFHAIHLRLLLYFGRPLTRNSFKFNADPILAVFAEPIDSSINPLASAKYFVSLWSTSQYVGSRLLHALNIPLALFCIMPKLFMQSNRELCKSI